MKTHKFSVTIPNPTDKPIALKLSLKAAALKELIGLIPDAKNVGQLQILRAGISLDPCKHSTRKSISIKLPPFTSVNAYVHAQSADSKKQAVAGFHIVDTRKSNATGGVLLVCTSQPVIEPAGVFIPAVNGCPAVMATNPYGIKVGEDVTKPSFKIIPSGEEVELIAQITNPTTKPLQDVKIYLEHLGGAVAEFLPGTWNARTLNTGDIFYASWKLNSHVSFRSEFEPSIVVSAQGHEPVRLKRGLIFNGHQQDR